MLTVEGLRAGYGPIEVLHGLDLTVSQDEVVVVIGPNGHGKSTLLRAVSGLIARRGGTVHFQGERIDGLSAERVVQRGLVHIPQGDLLFPDMTVAENLRLGAFRDTDRRSRSEQLDWVCSVFPRLGERLTQRARTLSGGERRMVALGRGLMSRARLLMIDEPSLGLAPILVEELYRQIRQIAASGVTVLLVEENFARVREIADRLYLIEDGDVVMSGTADQVLTDSAVTLTYLGIDGIGGGSL